MSLFADLIARISGQQQAPQGNSGLLQQALAQTGQQAPQGMGRGLMQQAMAQAGAQPQQSQPQGGGLMARVMGEAMQTSAQPSQGNIQGQSMADMMPQGSGFGGASAGSPWAQLLGNMSAGGFGGVSSQDPVERFRQMFGRDPQSQQELAMVGGPAISQVMG